MTQSQTRFVLMYVHPYQMIFQKTEKILLTDYYIGRDICIIYNAINY